MSKKVSSLLKNEMFQVALVIFIALVVKVFYFVISSGQTLWWDEAEYMSAAKHWALGVPYDLNEQRPPLFQLLAAFLLKIGFGETALKFILVALPSITLIVAVYYLGKELYGHKTGLISAFATSLVWSINFWSVRFQPDFLSLNFQVLSFLFFWRFLKHKTSKYAIFTGLMCAAGFYFKISALLVPLSIVIFSLYYEGFSLFTKKNYWLILIAFIIGLIPFMIWQWISFGSPLAFAPSYSGDFNTGRNLGWGVFDFFYKSSNSAASFPGFLFFMLFLVGVVLFLLNYFLKINENIFKKENRFDPSILSIITLLVIAFFYLFYIKGTIEDRWVLLVIPFIFFFAAKPINLVASIINKKGTANKSLKIVLIVLIITVFTYYSISQISYTTDLINNKKLTYLPVKDASLIIKDNSDPEDKVFSVSYTQTTDYSERKVITYADLDKENFTKLLLKEKPKFIMASIIEPHHPLWMVKHVQNDQGYIGIIFEYFNSSIIVSPQGQIVQYDLKKKISNNLADFTLIYPTDNNFGGLVLYKVDYKI